MSITLGAVIWSSVKPIIKIYLIIGSGFLLARMGILTVEATKSISNIVLTLLLPCLSFNKIVANIEDQDIKMVGIICLSSVLIFGTGLFFAWVISKTMPVPKEWKGGILAGGMFPNISDLPIAYLQTMNQGFIFSEEEGEKGVANVIIFLAMFLICVFNLGGFRLIESDFKYNDVENAITESESTITNDSNETSTSVSYTSNIHTEKQSLDKARDNTNEKSNDSDRSKNNSESDLENESLDSFSSAGDLSLRTTSTSDDIDDINRSQGKSATRRRNHTPMPLREKNPRTISRVTLPLQHTRRNSVTASIRSTKSLQAQDMNDLIQIYSNVDQYGNDINADQSQNLGSLGNANTGKVITTENKTNAARTVLDRIRGSNLTRILTSDATVSRKDIEESGKSLPKWLHKKLPITKFIVFFLKNCLRPCSMAVIVALTIAFIPWVKALFVTTKHTPHIRQAPDRQPALSFIMDFTAYVGAASVPFGLILLGATLGRLKIGKLYPGFWRSAVVLVFLRQCIMPIFGVLWCDRLVKAGWVSWEKDKMLLFVIAISWALPTMTTLIYFTASYTPPELLEPIQMQCVSFFLMIQYPLMVVSLPFLVSYFLKVQMKV